MTVVYGTVCRDRLHRVSAIPEPGGYCEIESSLETFGGEAANTCYALRKWGLEAALIGNPPGTEWLKHELLRAGLGPVGEVMDTQPEPTCDVYVTPDGQRTMFGSGFRNLPEARMPACPSLGQGDWFTADMNLGAAARIAAVQAKAEGAFTYLEDFVEQNDPSGTVWQSSTDWLGRRGHIQFNCAWLERRQVDRDEFGILSDGANGFVAGGTLPDGSHLTVRHFPPFPCERVVDSTGAGDSFRAGLLFGFAKGWQVGKSLAFASAVGSLNCRSLGATAGVPTLDEAHSLVKDHPDIARAYDL